MEIGQTALILIGDFLFLTLIIGGIIAFRMILKARSQLKFQDEILKASANAVAVTDKNGKCLWINPAFTQITGYSAEEIVGEKLSKLKSGVQNEEFYRTMWETINGGQTWRGEIVNKNKEGQLFIEDLTISSVLDKRGEITHFIAVMQDVSERKHTEADLKDASQRIKFQTKEIQGLRERLREETIRDTLTGLYNRLYFEETVSREIARARREGYDVCLVVIEVDNFKLFNEIYGRKAGDLLLKSLGDILYSNTRKNDVSSRLDGEKFAVAMVNSTMDGARKRAHQWRKGFQLLQHSYNGKGFKDGISISIGIASFPEHGGDWETALNAAERALLESKRRGMNRVSVFKETVGS